jgi:hypothetical protein
MNVKTIFKIHSVIFLLNGLGQLFATATFFEMATMEITPDLVAIGQFMGVTFIFLSFLMWNIPNLAGDTINKFGSLWALACLMWTAIIGYHIYIGVAGGSTAFVNIGLFALFAILYFTSSRDKKTTS